MMRKSPFRHKVRPYTRRDGTQVDMYHRGKGKKPRETLTGGGRKPSVARMRKPPKKTVTGRKPRKSRVRRGLRAPSTPFRSFHVRVTFPDGKSEAVPSVSSTSYAGAIDKGLIKRERGDAPKSILVRRRV